MRTEKLAFAEKRLQERLAALRERNADTIARIIAADEQRSTIGQAFHAAREEATAAEFELEATARRRAKGAATNAEVEAADERVRRAQLALRGYDGALAEAASAVQSCRSKKAALLESAQQAVGAAAAEMRAIAMEALQVYMGNLAAIAAAELDGLTTAEGEPFASAIERGTPELNSDRFASALRQALGEGRGMVSVTLRDGSVVAPDSIEAAREQDQLNQEAQNAGTPPAQPWKSTGTYFDDLSSSIRGALG